MFRPITALEGAQDLAHSIIHDIHTHGIHINDDIFSAHDRDLNALLLEVDWLERHGHLNAAGIGHGLTRVVSESTRGDLHCWLTTPQNITVKNSKNSEQNNNNNDNSSKVTSECVESHIPHLRTLVQDIQALGEMLSQEYNLEFDRHSVQVAKYPGEGARYKRHADATPFHSPHRRLTAIFYLNDPGKVNGGNLRLYRKESSFNDDSDGPKLYRGENNEIDVQPRFPRLILFPSDCYHEVLPAFSPRCAVTCWFYSRHSFHQRALEKLNQRMQQISASSLEQEQANSTIFVSICSYRDPECQFTVDHLFQKAEHPSRIRVGICWQYNAEKDVEKCFQQLQYRTAVYADRIREIHMSHHAAKGPVFARFLIQKYLYRDESFYLQIDSHMRFEQNWDTRLIQMLQQCEHMKGHQRCILSTYPPGYELPNIIPNISQPTLLCARKNFVTQRMDHPTDNSKSMDYDMVRLHARIINKPLDQPVESLFWAAGYSFSRGMFVRDVPYPDDLPHCFFGEEMLMLRRLFDRGYTVFAPHEVLIYHLWSRCYRTTIWQDQKQQKQQTAQPVDLTDDCQSGKDDDVLVASSVETVQIDPAFLEEHSSEQVQLHKISSCFKVQQKLGIRHMSCNGNDGKCDEDTTEREGCEVSLVKFQDRIGIHFAKRQVSERAEFGGYNDCDHLI